jgi:hypothetical protein
MNPIPAETIVEELSSDLQDLLVREAFVRRRRQQILASLEAQRAQEAGLEGTRPAFLAFRKGAKDEFMAAAGRLREEIVAGEKALANCDLILKKCDRNIAKEIEGLLAQRSAPFRDLLAARKLLPEWQEAVGLYVPCLTRCIRSLGIARNQMSAGYDRKSGKFSTGSLEAFAGAVSAAKALEAEAGIPNRLAKRQRQLLGLGTTPAAAGGDSAALPLVLGEELPMQVAPLGSMTLEAAATRISALIDECERLQADGVAAMKDQGTRIEGILNARWERFVATPLAEIRTMADGMVDDSKMESVYTQMEARFVTLTA